MKLLKNDIIPLHHRIKYAIYDEKDLLNSVIQKVLHEQLKPQPLFDDLNDRIDLHIFKIINRL